MLPEVAFGVSPWDRDGRRRTTQTRIPADFPCGPARLVESPSAACNWVQRLLRRQHRPDVVTAFQVSCGG